ALVLRSCAVTRTAMVELAPTAGTASAGDAVPLETATGAPPSCATVIDLAPAKLAVAVTVTEAVPKGTAAEYAVVERPKAGLSAPPLIASAESVASLDASCLTTTRYVTDATPSCAMTLTAMREV